MLCLDCGKTAQVKGNKWDKDFKYCGSCEKCKQCDKKLVSHSISTKKMI